MISADMLQSVSSMLAEGKASQPGIDQVLRTAFPGMPFSVCSDNDIPSRIKPLLVGAGFALYGMSSNGHCVTLSSDPETSSGLTIALIDDED